MKRNIIANFIGKFWALLSNFLFIPLYIHYLGFESYSIISFTLLIAGIMAILDGGLTATLSREFARTDNGPEDKLKIFRNLEFLYLIVVTLTVLIVLSFSGIIAKKWMNLESYNTTQAAYFLKIISFDIGFQLLFRFYMGGLLGLEKQVQANVYQVGWGIFRNGLVVFAIILAPTLDVFFLWQTLSTIFFTILIKLSLEKELFGVYTLNFKLKIESEVFKRIWKFAGGMMAIALVAALNTQMDKIAISKFLSLENLGYYTLAVSLSQGIIVLATPVGTALLPRFTSLYSEKRNNEASMMFNQISLLMSILIFAFMSNMCFSAKDLIWAWTGQITLADRAAMFLPILAMSMSMLAIVNLPYNIAIANGYTKLNNILGIISIFITLPGYWVATQYYGAVGAASVFCVVQIITTFTYLHFINKKFLGARIFKDIYFKQILLPLVLSLGLAYLFSTVFNTGYSSRIIALIWIGTSTFLTLLLTTLILVPIQVLKNIIKFKKI